MRKFFLNTYIILFFSFGALTAQSTQADSYYSGISVSNPSFISTLQTLIRSNYTRITYDQFDETNVANFASRDTTGGQRVVTCVYSGEQYLYTAPFTWGHFSREHSWCQSWMPSYGASGFSSRPEYSDQHHIFPTNQDNANGVRNNHPQGIVVSITSSYLLSKYGKDSENNNVFEPRSVQKGDFARALLYMSLRYNGVDGYDWTFNRLNTVTLPGLNERTQDLALLIQWSKEDPPSSNEIARNDYIQSIQGNRNPFIDHPEWVNYINFNDLSILEPTYLTEPTNHVTNLSVSNITTTSMDVTWTNAVAGAQAPSYYLLEVFSNTNDYFLPADGSSYSNDTDLSDGRGVINITNSGTTTYSLGGLTSGVTYYIRMFSYNGSTTSINYKIDGTVPTTNGATSNGSLLTEPTNYATSLSTGTVTSSSITLNWTDAIAAAQAPSGYLLKINTTGTFTSPTDGTSYSDNSTTINIAYPSSGTYTVTGLESGVQYYFELYSYNGSGTSINYKTSRTVPSANATTLGISANDIMITHYSPRYNTASDEYIVLFNNTDSSIDINGYEIAYGSSGGAISVKKSFTTSTIIPSRGYYLLASNASVTAGSVSNKSADATFSNGFADDGQVAFRKTSNQTVIYALATGTITSYVFGLNSSAVNPGSASAFQLTVSAHSYVRSGNNSNDYTRILIASVTEIPNSGNALLPVELTSFDASVNNKSVILNWTTATEVNNYGFNIERKIKYGDGRPETGDWTKIGYVNGHGNSNSPKYYSYIDKNVPAGKMQYRLKQIDFDGAFEYSKVIEVKLEMPFELKLEQNYPNPSNPSTTIRYQIPTVDALNVSEMPVTLKVYDLLGREVATLVNEQKNAGNYEVKFDGSKISSGIYIYKLEWRGYVEAKKLVLMK